MISYCKALWQNLFWVKALVLQQHYEWLIVDRPYDFFPAN